jgi:hypothetical protein
MTRAAVQTKRNAARAAQAAEDRANIPTVCTDASGARIRTVEVHLTPFAPGVRELPLHHPRRWATFYGVSPAQAVRTTLKRLNQSPRHLTAAVETPGDVSLQGAVPPELLRLLSGDPERVPFAVFTAGLTLAEVEAALAGLVAARWEPPVALPANL